MSPSSNSVYSSVFTYNPYVLTRPYRHLTFVASIEPYRITCVSHDISVSIDRARACRMDTPNRQKHTRRSSTKVSWLLTNFVTHRGCSDSSTYSILFFEFSAFLWLLQVFQLHAVQQHRVPVHCDRAFYQK